MGHRESARTGRSRATRPLIRAGVVAVILAAALPALTGITPGIRAPVARAADWTGSRDPLRTSWDPYEPAITPASVKTFTQLFKTPVSGQVYAQPLVVGSTVIVATEADQVYGLNAATGAIEWQTSLGAPYQIPSCVDLSPDIGVTGTPVYDPPAAGTGGHGTVYLVAQTVTGNVPGYSFFGIDPVTGAITQQVPIGGSPANDPSITFDPAQQLERPGLLLTNGWVYAAFSSHCDNPPYDGFVAGVNVATRATTLWTDESGITDDQAGIWQSGGGLMSDGPGRIFVTSGNGVSPPPGKGTAPPGQLAESVIRLAADPITGALSARDFYSPVNASYLDGIDGDFGSGGPVGLPFGTTRYQHVMVQAGKYGQIFLLNRQYLGGRAASPKVRNGALSINPVWPARYPGLWGHPAVFGNTSPLTAANAAAASDYLYYVGKNDSLRVLKFGVNGGDEPTLTDVANSSLVFGYTSGSPVVTSDGTNPATTVVWVTYNPMQNGQNAQLEAYDVSSGPGGALANCSATVPCSLSPIFSAPLGQAAKFTTVATSGGRVYLGTRDGNLYGFGAPPPAAPITGAAASFGRTRVSSATARTVSVTAAKTVTVTGVTAATGASNSASPARQFTVGKVTETRPGGAGPAAVKFPVTLAQGDKLHAAVKFAPAAAGGAGGTLSFATRSAGFPAIRVPLAGDGTQPGLVARPGSVTFPLAPDQGINDVPVGIKVPQVVDLTNYGTAPDTVTSVRPPSGPFRTAGLPAPGTTIMPGRSVPIQVSFTPARPGPASGSLTITGTRGAATTISLSGTGTAAVSRVTAAGPALNLHTVRVGTAATRYIHVTNSGNTLATVAGTGPLPAPFTAPLRAGKDLPFNPGYDLVLPVRFAPRRPGTFTARYRLAWTDRSGRHTLTVRLTGTGTSSRAGLSGGAR